jgi:hypothetical protein
LEKSVDVTRQIVFDQLDLFLDLPVEFGQFILKLLETAQQMRQGRRTLRNTFVNSGCIEVDVIGADLPQYHYGGRGGFNSQFFL